MVVFVIGANCTGKSRFIADNFDTGEYAILNVYDYQKKLEREERARDFSTYREQLFRANEQLQDDMVDLVRQGKDVVVEHTFLRALRRIGFVEAIQETSKDVPIEVYAMTPSDAQLRHNCEERAKELGESAEAEFKRVKREITEVFEFPNPSEGFAKIYAVTDGAVTERMDAQDLSRIECAREELQHEVELKAEKQAKRKKHEKLVEATKHIRFWHYCDACGKKELLTADEAYNQGWDYPPGIYKFRLFTPRTCGDCSITGSLYWKIVVEKKSLTELTENEKASFMRIMNEPESLMPEEGEL